MLGSCTCVFCCTQLIELVQEISKLFSRKKYVSADTMRRLQTDSRSIEATTSCKHQWNSFEQHCKLRKIVTTDFDMNSLASCGTFFFPSLCCKNRVGALILQRHLEIRRWCYQPKSLAECGAQRVFWNCASTKMFRFCCWTKIELKPMEVNQTHILWTVASLSTKQKYTPSAARHWKHEHSKNQQEPIIREYIYC